MGALMNIESVSPATATSMRGTTRRFGSGGVHRAAVRLESRTRPYLAFPCGFTGPNGLKVTAPWLTRRLSAPWLPVGVG